MKVHKGFTLVELMIVIVIIGILAVALLLSGSAATAEAEAANIISDLRSLKAAAVAMYADSIDIVINDYALNTVGSLALLKPYMSNPDKILNNGPYEFFKTTIAGVGVKWWVVYDLDRSNVTKKVEVKLAAKADSVGLYFASGGGTVYRPFRAGDRRVHMVAR